MHNYLVLFYQFLSKVKEIKFKTMKTTIYLIIAILMASCTIQKRHYSKGWNIEWHKRFASNQTKNIEINKIAIDSQKVMASDQLHFVDTNIKPEIVIVQIDKPIIKNGSENSRSIETTSTKQESVKLTSEKIEFSTKTKTYSKISQSVKKTNQRKFKPRNKNATKVIGLGGAILIIIGVIIILFALSILITLMQLFGVLLSIF